MPKAKRTYVCSECGYESVRWYGKCPGCDAWNTMEEVVVQSTQEVAAKPAKQRGGTGAVTQKIYEIEAAEQTHLPTGIGEFDRVLGGGIVDGSLMLVGGEPGVGKSTLLLQVCAQVARQGKRVMYVSGEESARQIRLRADRLGVAKDEIDVLAENAVDAIEEKLNAVQPDLAVIDSIQTTYRPDMSSAPGSVSQVRESAAVLMRWAKTNGCAVILVGHVTKEGAIAGPRVLEHMVDVVLYFEGDYQHEYRLLRAVKNRFGSVNELGMFSMTETGMLPVENASETLISNRTAGASGSVIFCCMEGSRPMLVDLQALASHSFYAVPRRTVNGADQGRVALLLAVLEKRAGLRLYDQDVYVNVAGGLSLSEPAVDLPLCVAVASSLQEVAVPSDFAIMGEVGLTGEVRAITQMERRISECVRLGFKKIMCPYDSAKHVKNTLGAELIPVKTLAQAITLLGIRR